MWHFHSPFLNWLLQSIYLCEVPYFRNKPQFSNPVHAACVTAKSESINSGGPSTRRGPWGQHTTPPISRVSTWEEWKGRAHSSSAMLHWMQPVLPHWRDGLWSGALLGFWTTLQRHRLNNPYLFGDHFSSNLAYIRPLQVPRSTSLLIEYSQNEMQNLMVQTFGFQPRFWLIKSQRNFQEEYFNVNFQSFSCWAMAMITFKP